MCVEWIKATDDQTPNTASQMQTKMKHTYLPSNI